MFYIYTEALLTVDRKLHGAGTRLKKIPNSQEWSYHADITIHTMRPPGVGLDENAMESWN